MSHPFIVSIEGNIGSGKSTVLEKLKEAHPEWIFVEEPVNEWLRLRNENHESLLEVFYKDKKRWSYTFQNAAILYRYQKLKEALEKCKTSGRTIIIMERCLDTDSQIFCKMLHKDGYIDELEKKLYEDWFSHLRSMCPEVNAFVYINTNAELSYQRLVKRSREGESVIPLDYLQELEDYHRKWLLENQTKPVLNFDNTQETIHLNCISEFVLQMESKKEEKKWLEELESSLNRY